MGGSMKISGAVVQRAPSLEVGDPHARTESQRRADAPRGMAVDNRNATVEVNRHHAEARGFRLTASRQQNSSRHAPFSGNGGVDRHRAEHGETSTKLGKAASGLGAVSKATSKYAGAVAKISGHKDHGVREIRSEHVSGVSGAVSGGLALVSMGFASLEIHRANKEIKQGQAAEQSLREIERNIDERGIDTEGLAQVSVHAKAIAQAEEARTSRVNASLEFVKSTGEVAAVGTELAGHAAAVGALVGGAAAGLVSIGLGARKVYQAGKQTEALNQKMQALDRARSSSTANADDLKAAAEDIKKSREKHISNSKWGGIAKIGMGIATFALMGVAMAGVAAAAPLLLPILGIGLLTAGVATGVTGIVRAVERNRSEKKIDATIQAAVQNQGAMTLEQQRAHLSQINSKNLGRDALRIDKVNAAVASINQTLNRLAQVPAGEEPRGAIIAHFTDDAFVKGSEKAILERVLNGLNPDNVEAHRSFLLGALAKNMLS